MKENDFSDQHTAYTDVATNTVHINTHAILEPLTNITTKKIYLQMVWSWTISKQQK